MALSIETRDKIVDYLVCKHMARIIRDIKAGDTRELYEIITEGCTGYDHWDDDSLAIEYAEISNAE